VAASGDPFLGARFGAKVGDYFRDSAGAVGLMLLSSDTLRVAVDRLTRYQRHWNEGERYEVEERQGRLRIRYRPWGPPRPAHVQVAEKVAGQILFGARFASGGEVEAEIRFAHRARPKSGEVGRLLQCKPVFGSQHNEIVLPASVLDRRLPTADAALFRVLDRHLAERIRAITPQSDPADHTRKALSDYLHQERLSLGTIARVLGSTERTLQRRLSQSGTSFRRLVDEVRESRARALLRAGTSIAEICLLLGYTEETAFFRAFKRWTGTTPEAWRAGRGEPNVA
jgi:AraC-like DNA-binding protein